MYAVYALIDPDEIYKVCYIGISQDVYTRFTQHLQDINRSNSKAQWLRSLRERNRVPYCKVLEDMLTEEEARKKEAHWIHFYLQLNMPLTNANIPLMPQSYTPPSKPPVQQEIILELYDKGMSGRTIEKWLSKGDKKVSYREIAKTLTLHRPDWNKRGMSNGNVAATERNTSAENEMDVRKNETDRLTETAS